jgi:nucleoside-diphosphate-sugar epimerase
VEEAETVHVPPPPTEKLLVLGGNGFVGSHVCKEALDRGLSVSSLSRYLNFDCRELTHVLDQM